jgi:hypothetical protein
MGKHEDQAEPTIRRPAGVRVVVQVPTMEQKALVLDALLRHHALGEEAEGTWRNGAWADFDPVSVPGGWFLRRIERSSSLCVHGD